MNEKKQKLTISDLKNDTNENNVSETNQPQFTEVNEGEILPYKEEKTSEQEFTENIMDKLGKTVERVKDEVKEINKDAEVEEDEDDDEDLIEPEIIDIKTNTKVINKVENNEKIIEQDDIDEDDDIENEKLSSQSIDIDDEDFDDLDDDEETDDEETEQQLKEMQTKIKEKISPVSKVIDLTTYTISKTPVSVSSILNSQESNSFIADWILPSANKIISMREFGGYEIENLRQGSSGRNRYNEFKKIYKIIFDHIVDPDKPVLLESWLKSFSFFDNDHLFFAIYKASFSGANYIPFQCTHCKHVFVSDDVNINDMVKYKDEETKQKALKLLESNSSIGNTYDIDLLQVSDNYVFGFKEPSIFNVLFENLLLDEKFLSKYNNLLSLLTYVDSIYLIDRTTNQLKPVEPKVYRDNPTKTLKSKIKCFSKIFQSLNSDQLYEVDSYRNSISKSHEGISYAIPEIKCPKCGKIIPEQNISAEQLLFTRHQLAALANM